MKKDPLNLFKKHKQKQEGSMLTDEEEKIMNEVLREYGEQIAWLSKEVYHKIQQQPDSIETMIEIAKSIYAAMALVVNEERKKKK